MAKLKIIDNDDVVVRRKPNVQGYVNLVERLILNPAKYDEFLDAEDDERPGLLQAAAGQDAAARPCVIEHQTSAGVSEPIDGQNCVIRVAKDKKKVTKRSRIIVKVPDAPLVNVDYLDVYAQEIHDLYAAGQFDRAHKFLFGMMLLTRCR